MDQHPSLHHKPYGPLIDETLSQTQTGRTILVTGASTGIGLAIAKAFIQCDAGRVILTGRRPQTLQDAKQEIESENPRCRGEVMTITTDLGSREDVEALWVTLKQDGLSIDTLVLNATQFKPAGKLLDNKVEDIWNSFEVGVEGNWRMTARFAAQGRSGKVLLNVASNAAHLNPFFVSTYAASKSALCQLLQHLADEVSVEELRVHNFHPGSVYTPAVINGGFPKDAIPWDEPALPGRFAVWLSTSDAAFLHGRFVWSGWDISMLKGLKAKLDAEPGMLKLGLQGMPPLSMDQLFEQLNRERPEADCSGN